MRAEVTILQSPAAYTLAELAQIAVEPRVAELDALVDAARELDLFYIPTRYPDGLVSGTPGEAFSFSQAQRAIEHTVAIVEAAAQAVEPSSRP